MNTLTGTKKESGFPLPIDYVDVRPSHFDPHVLSFWGFDPTEHRFSPGTARLVVTASVGVPL